MKEVSTKNSIPIELENVPLHNYEEFASFFQLLKNDTHHCVNYFATEETNQYKLYACIANDETHEILINSCVVTKGSKVFSLTPAFPCLHVFEREIFEEFDIEFTGLTWNKPLRFPFNRKNTKSSIAQYPFYETESHELHEVGVGPIHAGIIEPGHFRFICNGEKVLHLEIQLGYQHRGIEQLMQTNKSFIYQTKLAESISGDSVVANTLTYSRIIESLSSTQMSDAIQTERAIALELERIAIHTGDLSALCADIAYQFGTVVFQDLRTIIINSFLTWCGNRFARKLISPTQNKYPITGEIKEKLLSNLAKYEERYHEMADLLFNLPSVLARFENTGVVLKEQAKQMQFVGMASRTSGILRDIRISHPTETYTEYPINSHVLESGDVMARAKLRSLEINESLNYIKKLLALLDNSPKRIVEPASIKLKPNSMVVSLTEGWRGEICHTAITNNSGEIIRYKVKDPSLHNWFALALAVRDNDISDFPICNKSFDLSYCGHDL